MNRRHDDTIKYPWAYALLIIIALCIVSALDYQDEQAEADHCARMVEEGTWPPEVCTPN